GEGNAPVGGWDDERRGPVSRHPVPALVPEVVVGDPPAARPPRIPGARLPLLRVEQIAVQAVVLAGLELGRLRWRQDILAAERRGPLQRRDRGERERALEVGLAIGGARRRAHG